MKLTLEHRDEIERARRLAGARSDEEFIIEGTGQIKKIVFEREVYDD